MKHAVKESDELYLWLLRQVVGKMEGLSLHLNLFMWNLLSALLGKKHMPFGLSSLSSSSSSSLFLLFVLFLV